MLLARARCKLKPSYVLLAFYPCLNLCKVHQRLLKIDTSSYMISLLISCVWRYIYKMLWALDGKYDINHFNNFLNTINHLNMDWITYLRMIAHYMGPLWPHLGLNYNMYNIIAPKMKCIELLVSNLVFGLIFFIVTKLMLLKKRINSNSNKFKFKNPWVYLRYA